MERLGNIAGRALAWLIVILVIAFAWWSAGYILGGVQAQAADVAQNPLASVVSIKTDLSGCSAFRISLTRFVTAGHCVSNMNLPVTIYDGQTGAKIGEATAVLVDKIDDLTILESYDVAKTVAIVPVECSPVHVGEPIAVVGDPGGIDTVVASYGHVVGLPAPRADGHWPLAFLVDAKADHGVSGGAVIDAVTGKVVGILVGGIPATSEIYVAVVPATTLCRVIGQGTV